MVSVFLQGPYRSLLSLSALCHERQQEEDSHLSTGRGLSAELDYTGTLISDLQNCEKQILLFISLSVYSTLLL